jgi:hypothetical protein
MPKLISVKELIDKYKIYEQQIIDLLSENDNIKVYDNTGRLIRNEYFIQYIKDEDGKFIPENQDENTKKFISKNENNNDKEKVCNKDEELIGYRYFIPITVREIIDTAYMVSGLAKAGLRPCNGDDPIKTINRTNDLSFIHDYLFEEDEIDAAYKDEVEIEETLESKNIAISDTIQVKPPVTKKEKNKQRTQNATEARKERAAKKCEEEKRWWGTATKMAIENFNNINTKLSKLRLHKATSQNHIFNNVCKTTHPMKKQSI